MIHNFFEKFNELSKTSKKVIACKKYIVQLLNQLEQRECEFSKFEDYINNLEAFDPTVFDLVRSETINSGALFNSGGYEAKEKGYPSIKAFLLLYNNGFFNNCQDKYKISLLDPASNPYTYLISIFNNKEYLKILQIKNSEISKMLENGITYNIANKKI